tara:strand:+ start:192 stop:326 length:135 start_codon:yes stop_codon:yes gene_type:complete
MNDFEIRELYEQVQKIEEELKMMKQYNGGCCHENCNCDCCDKEE